MEESGNHSSRHHHRRRKENFLDRFFKNFFNSGAKTAPSEQQGAVYPASTESATAQDEPHPHHHRRQQKKENPVSVYFWQRMEQFAQMAERRREKRKRQKYQREYRRGRKTERLRNHPVRIFFRELFSKKVRSYYEEPEKQKAESSRQRNRLVIFSLNSTCIYIITFFIAYLTYQVAVMFTASRWSINSALFYYEVFFPIGNNSDKWNSFNITIITFMGPFISLIMGIIYILFYVRKVRISGLTKLFFFWLGLHSLNFFLGAFVGGMVTSQGFGYVIEWMFMPTWLRFGVALIFLFILGLVGYIHTRYFLQASGSVYWTHKGNKPWLILAGAVAPWFFSIIFLFIVRFPNVVPQHNNIVIYDSVMYMTMLFPIAAMFINFYATTDSSTPLTKSGTRRINWIYVILFVSLVLIFRLGLNSGFYYLPF